MSKFAKTASKPPQVRSGLVKDWLKSLFGTPFNALVSLGCLWLAWHALHAAIGWLVLRAVIQGGPQACKAGHGACWPFVEAKLRLVIFGIYPRDEQWRMILSMLILLAACLISMLPRFWGRALLVLWGIVASLVALLVAGGAFGLTYIPASYWSGLPLSIILSLLGMAFGLPLGTVLALARASRLPAIRAIATLLIEFIRGVPLISVLFMASVMLPLFMPAASGVGKFLSVQISIVVFAGAYIAEIVRGGLQAISRGQYDAADSLGLRYWQTMRLIVLPQAIRSVVPPLVAFFIGLFQDTTLVTLVGMLDFLSTVRAAMHDPNWQGIAVVDGYVLAGAVYLALSLGLGAYGRFLERLPTYSRSSKGSGLTGPDPEPISRRPIVEPTGNLISEGR